MVSRSTFLIGAATLALGACANPPDVEAALGPDPAGSDYPALLPIEDILGDQPVDSEADTLAQQRLDRRVSALKSRAAALRRLPTP